MICMQEYVILILMTRGRGWGSSIGIRNNMSFIQIMQNQQETTTKSLSSSTKWIDYSDDESPPQNSDSDDEPKQPNSKDPNNTNQEQYALDKLDSDMVWLLADVSAGNHKQLSRRLFDLKQEDDRVRVFNTVKDESEKWDVFVSKTMAERLMLKGIEDARSIVFKVHKRNFEKREDGQRGERRGRGRGGRGGREGREGREGGQRRDRGQRRQRGDRQRRDRGQKKKYVDKQTGKESENKKILEQRLNQEKDRQYTKKQSKQIGESFASFRTKTLEERRKQHQQKQQFREKEGQKQQRKEKFIQKQKQKEPVNVKPDTKPKEVWRRKGTFDQGQSQITQGDSQKKPEVDTINSQAKQKTQAKEPIQQQKKTYVPKGGKPTYKNKQGQIKERIDVNEQTSRLFKKASNIVDEKEYRAQQIHHQQMRQEAEIKKNEVKNDSLNNKDSKTQNNQNQNEVNRFQKKFSSRQYKETNYQQNRERGGRGRGRGNNRKYQEKKPVNNEEKADKAAEPPKKQVKKDSNNHFSGMMSDDSDN